MLRTCSRVFLSLTCMVMFAGVSSAVVINEFVVDHTGSDSHEFIELLGMPSTDYSDLTILEIEGDGNGAGLVDDGIFAVGSTDANGFWFSGYDPGGANDIENGSVTLLLVRDFSGAVGDDIDTTNDGTIDNPLWSEIVDSIGTSDGGGSDFVYGVDLPPGYDGNNFQPGGASRIPDGLDTDSFSDWVRNDFFGQGLPGFANVADPGTAINTAGAMNQVVVPEPGCLGLFAACGMLLMIGKRR